MFLHRVVICNKIIFRNMCKIAENTGLITTFNKQHVNFFMKALDTTKLQTYNIFTKYPNLHQIDLERLQQAQNILIQCGFSKIDFKNDPNVLAVLPASIEQHVLILQESGFNQITTTALRSYISLGRKRISLLKAHQYISDDVDVQQQLLSYLDKSFVMSPSIEINDKLSLNTVRLLVLRDYLKWHLQMNEEETEHLLKTYNRIKNKSFRFIRKTLKQLEDIGFTKDKIKRNGYLIHSHPHNTEKILTEVKELAGEDIRQVILKYPKLLMTNWETYIKTMKHLKEFNISDASIQRCPEIFTLGSDSVHERLMDLKKIPEFNVLCAHPRVLRLVHYQKKAISRLTYLQQMKVKCASLHVLSSSRGEFERYAREGSDRTKGKDIVSFLINAFGFSSSEIREILNRHQFWCHVPITAIEATLGMLKQRSYLNKHIVNNLHILLYPKNQVETILDELTSQRKHPDLPSVDNLMKLQRTKIIALCLYLLERKHHFTGNGIWDDQPQEMAINLDPNTPLPQETLGRNINYRYRLDKN